MNSKAIQSGAAAWEYIDINICRKLAALLIDSYRNFGWILTEKADQGLSSYHIGEHPYAKPPEYNRQIVKLKFKRDGGLPNRQ